MKQNINYLDYLTFTKYKKGIKLESGDIIQTNDGKFLLIGDVNEVLGICDDCTEFSKEDIYRIAKDALGQLFMVR
jgi:hypothetical protein